MQCSSCSQPVNPIVVCDIDGTLGDYHRHFTAFCFNYFAPDDRVNLPGVAPWNGLGEFEDYLGLTKQQYREAKLAYRQGGNKRWLPAYSGVSEMVRSVHDAGAEVWIATTRPWQRLDNVDPDTREWLRRNHIPYDGLLYGEDKYRQLVETVDPQRVVAVIEDLPEQYHKAMALRLPVILRDNYHNDTASHKHHHATLRACFEWAIKKIGEWNASHA